MKWLPAHRTTIVQNQAGILVLLHLTVPFAAAWSSLVQARMRAICTPVMLCRATRSGGRSVVLLGANQLSSERQHRKRRQYCIGSFWRGESVSASQRRDQALLGAKARRATSPG